VDFGVAAFQIRVGIERGGHHVRDRRYK
jgi:hypothetical protein